MAFLQTPPPAIEFGFAPRVVDVARVAQGVEGEIVRSQISALMRNIAKVSVSLTKAQGDLPAHEDNRVPIKIIGHFDMTYGPTVMIKPRQIQIEDEPEDA